MMPTPALLNAERRLPPHELLTSDEVAEAFRVNTATVQRWARERLLTCIRTPGGKLLRFRRDDVLALLRRVLNGEIIDHPAEAFARWVVSLDDADGPGAEKRKTVTLNEIIRRARESLALEDVE